MKKIAIYPGTFDPITNGHLDLVARAEQIFDEVIIAVSDNPRKNPLFTTAERVAMVDDATQHIPHVRVESFDDLLVNFVTRQKAKFVIRGLRAVSDFEYEFQLASANRRLDSNVETIFLTPSEANYFISSSLVREISYYKGDVSSFVPPHVELALQNKWAAGRPSS
ncbi:phosphopantetheine adenylyltransferase [Arenicella chitinivorans]|uniref:Phosphopantetheine adenylyltransferase n=1 Tax=Arenicella chitinivorans TaxID=1329800 RepID=A0A918RU55_9GAMM|nr:pantetheine-phosphate adenylyltransferase [Arenicella chitinivorans]GHA10107.1 phosphopantetheine adenylyltransferase [Arenicella chitinivorans]